VLDDEPISVLRDRARRELAKVHPGTRRFLNPHEYPVGLDPALHELRSRMIDEARQRTLAMSEAD
jgi:nicotinate phosphoribosyltransferase